MVNSITQDLGYNASFGRMKVQKPAQFGVCDKRMTCSVNFIHCLNRFGHTMPCYEANCEKIKLEKTKQTVYNNKITTLNHYTR